MAMELWVWECSLLGPNFFSGLLTRLSSPLLDSASLASPAARLSYLCFRTWLNQQRRSTQKWTEIACTITSRGSLLLVKDSEVHWDQSWDLSSRILSASALLSILLHALFCIYDNLLLFLRQIHSLQLLFYSIAATLKAYLTIPEHLWENCKYYCNCRLHTSVTLRAQVCPRTVYGRWDWIDRYCSIDNHLMIKNT
jgi:hypothetical protein